MSHFSLQHFGQSFPGRTNCDSSSNSIVVIVRKVAEDVEVQVIATDSDDGIRGVVLTKFAAYPPISHVDCLWAAKAETINCILLIFESVA
jgi:hypothetical protein